MTDEPRCCGSGVCIIDADGRCWCGQQWLNQPADQTPVEAEDSVRPTVQSERVR